MAELDARTPIDSTDRAPVRPERQRIAAVDALRGFAVLGLMFIHILLFSQPDHLIGHWRPSLPDDFVNQAFSWCVYVLVWGKFMFLFAMLFGASVVFFDRKTCGERLKDGAGLWYARMGWLAAIGLVHAIFIFFGDILLTYAVCGMGVLWWVRRWSPRRLIGLAVGLYGVGMIATFFVMWGFVALALGEIQTDDHIAGQIELYTGSYFNYVLNSVIVLLFNVFLVLPFASFWMTSGVMLLGMAMAKLGVITAQRSTRFYAVLAMVGVAVGTATSAALFHWVEGGGFDGVHAAVWLSMSQFVGIPLSFGYLGLIMLIAKLDVLRLVQIALAAVGRMALTNYLLHGVIGGGIFFGWGLGMFNELAYPTLLYIVLGIWAFEIAFSVIWLHFFRFGPVEWLWRSLTYMKLQPMMRGGGGR